MRVQLKQVSFGFRVPLVERCDVEFGPGWTGLVGANGAGKSTLLEVVLGSRGVEAGSVLVEPADAIVALCPQSVNALSEDVQQFAWNYEKTARRRRARLHLDVDALERWPQLSPGERKRWQIASALERRPEVLMLDEPTNHLDEFGRRLLLDELMTFEGIGILVSHDRSTLDALTNSTVRLHRRTLEHHPMPYTAAREQWEQTRLTNLAERRQLANKRRTLGATIAVTREKQRAAKRQTNAKHRMKNAHDTDGRSMLKTNMAQAATKRLGKDITRMQGQVERVEHAMGAIAVEKQLGAELFTDYEPAPKRILLDLSQHTVRFDRRVVLRDVTCQWERRDRVWLTGDNGSGKTTLLRALLASRRGATDRFLYLPQELDAQALDAMHTELLALDHKQLGHVCQLIGAQGTAPEQVLDSQRWSPGEAKKVAIALALARRVWGLVLDEPENHLDLPSVERLQALLRSFPGALLLVSHDETLARRVTTERWRMCDGALEVE